MTIYIALLRGINVGGKNKIKMADLKKMFEDLGLSEVKTYIQSGNVIFKSNETEEALRNKIEQGIETVFGFSIAVILITAEELENIIQNCPFSKEEVAAAEAASDSECLYVSLLLQPPSQENIDRLSTYKSDHDIYHVEGRQVYLLFSNSIRNSKLANNLQKLDVPSTVRNWKTINKLSQLVKEQL
ncbi:MAG: DUF1697 domain-containing protein [Bacillota bacterium]|nr:DUF1697 domain-containing protein [Bacillota bacterium]